MSRREYEASRLKDANKSSTNEQFREEMLMCQASADMLNNSEELQWKNVLLSTYYVCWNLNEYKSYHMKKQ
ncbi:hypothetical protein LDENG_00198920 [Lucifuga dentata]|nr:hypothetical protein LDENG_00198920 [Lucifuga dentata]